jgi:hypothetical protein
MTTETLQDNDQGLNPASKPRCETIGRPALKRAFQCGSAVLCLTLYGIIPSARAQEQPAPPAITASLPNQQLPGSISGTITDQDGATIAGARITLTRDGHLPTASQLTVSSPEGRFTFRNVPPGPFKLTISANGSALNQASDELHSGETLELSAISLRAATSTDIQVTATQADIAQAQIHDEEQQRVLGVFPNFFVSYVPNPVPLTPKQKWELSLKTIVDPVSLAVTGVAAGAQQATNTYSGYGQGSQGYAKRYAASYGSFLTGTVLGNAVFPIVFKQDPRYFYKGTGSTRSRILYAVANSVICKGDNMRWQPNYSSILGGLASAGISNLYYPAADRNGAGLTFENATIGIGATAAANLIQEFLIRKITRHIPASAPTQP